MAFPHLTKITRLEIRETTVIPASDGGKGIGSRISSEWCECEIRETPVAPASDWEKGYSSQTSFLKNISEKLDAGIAPISRTGSKVGKTMIYKNEILSMERRISELADEAKEIASDHWQWHLRENAMLAPREKGRLNVWIRNRKGGLEISWSHFRFVKFEGNTKSKPSSTHIAKGRSHRYTQKSLEAKGKPWEMEKVMETEERLSRIRAEYTKVRKALTGLKEARKLALDRGITKRAAPEATNIKPEEVEA